MKFIRALLLGLVVGGALVYFLFVGTPRTKQTPGEPVRAPEASGPPPGTAIVELDEPFFNTLLGTIFSDLGQPTFRLADGGPRLMPAERAFDFSYVRAQEGGGGGCENKVVLAPEGGGVRTGVRLENGQVLAPLASAGLTNVPLLGCREFRGTAEANIDLRFAAAEQTPLRQLNVAAVTLEGMSPVFIGVVTNFVQEHHEPARQPLVLMRGQQISLSIPVQAPRHARRAGHRHPSEIKTRSCAPHHLRLQRGEGRDDDDATVAELF